MDYLERAKKESKLFKKLLDVASKNSKIVISKDKQYNRKEALDIYKNIRRPYATF